MAQIQLTSDHKTSVASITQEILEIQQMAKRLDEMITQYSDIYENGRTTIYAHCDHQLFAETIGKMSKQYTLYQTKLQELREELAYAHTTMHKS